MRKKLKMRGGGKVAKYAEGGRVAGRGIRQGLRAPMAGQNRVQEAGRVMGPAPADAEMDVAAPAPRSAMATPAGADMPVPPIPPRRARTASTVTRTRSREMSADELNDREMTRILNERSLEAARAGRNIYRKGGMVSAKKGKK